MGDDTKVVGHGIADFFGLFRKGPVEEFVDRFDKPGKTVIGPVMGDAFVHDAPKPLDRVEMRSIRRQDMQFQPAVGPFQPWLQHPGMMVAGIVKKQVNAPRPRPAALECLEQSQGRFGIEPFPLNRHQAHLLKVQAVLGYWSDMDCNLDGQCQEAKDFKNWQEYGQHC